MRMRRSNLWRQKRALVHSIEYNASSMNAVSELFSRQLSLSGAERVSLSWVLKDLYCCVEDEVVLHGGMSGMAVPPFACKFTPDGLHGNLLAVADEEGSVRLMDSRKPASLSVISELLAHSNAIFDIAWVPGGKKLLTASGDRSVGLWDVVGGAAISSFKAHTGSVKSVDVMVTEPSVIASAGRDSSIMVWDTRCSLKGGKHVPVLTIAMAHALKSDNGTPGRKRGRRGREPLPQNSTSDSVTAVLFHGDNKLASVGATDGVVKMWDLRWSCKRATSSPKPWHSFTPTTDKGRSFGFTSLVSDPCQSRLFANCTNDIVYMYESSGLRQEPVHTYSGHLNSTFYVKAAVSSDGRYVMSGSSCGRAFVWEVDRPEDPPLLLTGHEKEVTAVAWCPTQLDKVVTCSDNNDLRIWRVSNRKPAAGECIGSCDQYTGTGHLKAVEVMQKFESVRAKRIEDRELGHLPKTTISPSPPSSKPRKPLANGITTKKQQSCNGLVAFLMQDSPPSSSQPPSQSPPVMSPQTPPDPSPDPHAHRQCSELRTHRGNGSNGTGCENCKQGLNRQEMATTDVTHVDLHRLNAKNSAGTGSSIQITLPLSPSGTVLTATDPTVAELETLSPNKEVTPERGRSIVASNPRKRQLLVGESETLNHVDKEKGCLERGPESEPTLKRKRESCGTHRGKENGSSRANTRSSAVHRRRESVRSKRKPKSVQGETANGKAELAKERKGLYSYFTLT